MHCTLIAYSRRKHYLSDFLTGTCMPFTLNRKFILINNFKRFLEIWLSFFEKWRLFVYVKWGLFWKMSIQRTAISKWCSQSPPRLDPLSCSVGLYRSVRGIECVSRDIVLGCGWLIQSRRRNKPLKSIMHEVVKKHIYWSMTSSITHFRIY